MPRQVFRTDEVRQLVQAGAQLVDVLGEKEFAAAHVPGAVNLSLKKLTAATAAALDRNRPVIVYCNDFS
jgi:rhodanese-related sulfurtransferase